MCLPSRVASFGAGWIWSHICGSFSSRGCGTLRRAWKQSTEWLTRNQIKLSRARRPILTTAKHGESLLRLMRMNHRSWTFFCNLFSMWLPIFTPFHLLVRRTCLWQILVNFGIPFENIVLRFQRKKNRADIYHIIITVLHPLDVQNSKLWSAALKVSM